MAIITEPYILLCPDDFIAHIKASVFMYTPTDGQPPLPLRIEQSDLVRPGVGWVFYKNRFVGQYCLTEV